MILTIVPWAVTLVPMDVLDEVAQLLSSLEAIEKEQRAGQEMGKAMLLRSALEDYVEWVKRRDWPKARVCLDRILRAGTYMISSLPESESKSE